MHIKVSEKVDCWKVKDYENTETNKFQVCIFWGLVKKKEGPPCSSSAHEDVIGSVSTFILFKPPKPSGCENWNKHLMHQQIHFPFCQWSSSRLCIKVTSRIRVTFFSLGELFIFTKSLQTVRRRREEACVEFSGSKLPACRQSLLDS